MSKLPSTTRSLPITLIRARESVMTPIREMLSETGLTEQQWRVLRVLEEFGPQDATQLAGRAGLMAPSLTRMVQTMQKAGTLTTVQDADDRRRQIVSITPAGAAIIDTHRDKAMSIAAGYRARLGDDRFEQLLDLLEQLIES